MSLSETKTTQAKKPSIKSLLSDNEALKLTIAKLESEKQPKLPFSFDFLEAVKARMDVRNFKVIRTGGMRLLRSDIPKDIAEPVPLYLDASSHLTLAINATILGVTPDELLRLLTWTFNEAYADKFRR